MKRFSAVYWGLVMGVATSLVHGQTREVAQAKEYFRAGAAAYGAGDYLAAIQALEAAYRLTPLPAIGFSLAQAERRQYFVSRDRAHLDRAIQLFRVYLEQVPRGGRRADSADALTQLEPLAFALEGSATPERPISQAHGVSSLSTRVMVSTQTPGARISLDGVASVPSPLIAEVTPGEHSVRVSADGFFSGERRLVAVRGELIPIEVQLRERPATVLIRAPSDADLYVDGIYRGPAGGALRMELAGGPHVFTFAKSGHRLRTLELDLDRGETQQIDASLSWTRQRWFAVGLFAGGGVTLIAGVAFASLAVRQQDLAANILDRRAEENIAPADLDQYFEAVEARNRLRVAAATSLVTSLGAMVTGLFLYALDQPDPSQILPRARRYPSAPPVGRVSLRAAPAARRLGIAVDF